MAPKRSSATWSARALGRRVRALSDALALRRVRQNLGGGLIVLDYPASASDAPRYAEAHPQLDALIGAGRERYAATLATVRSYADGLARIALRDPDDAQPSWQNAFLPGLDAAVLYALVRSTAPARYIEVGSGNSTQFAARARADAGLSTRIVSIDPRPRAEIDTLCDEIVRTPLEMLDLGIWNQVRPGDMVFIDGSHRVFMNSDVVAFFLDVLPRLPSGVLVGIHDIYLPYDYPQEIADRYYSEQYVLAAWLLAGAGAEVVFPAHWVFRRMRAPVDELWASHPGRAAIEPHGVAFWLRTPDRHPGRPPAPAG